MNAGASGLLDAAAVAEAHAPPCLVVNRASFRASRGLAAPAIALAREHGAEIVEVDRLETLAGVVRSLLAQRQRRVIVLAGDGTVRAIVDQLASQPAGAWLPELLVLPGGRTNLTALDLMPRGDALATLRRALRSSGDERRADVADERRAGVGTDVERRNDRAVVVERAVLRIEQDGAPVRHGFFIAGALVDGVIRRIHARRAERVGAIDVGLVSTVRDLLRLAALAFRGRTGLACPRLVVDAGVLGRLDGPMRFLLVTTLLHHGRLFDPYAARGAGDVRVTAVAARAPRFWLALPRLLTGRYSTRMDADRGYLSGRCERVEITGLAGYSLDGEPYDADPTQPVRVATGPRLRFLVP